MIVGFGIDAVEINRFNSWSKKPLQELNRIFSPDEIAYCLNNALKADERLAVRFAAREALYKALSPLSAPTVPFLTLCKATTITSNKPKDTESIARPPHITIDWTCFAPETTWIHSPENLKFHITMSHTMTTAIASVIVEKA